MSKTPINLKKEMERDGVTGNPAAYLAMKRQEIKQQGLYCQSIPWGHLNKYYNQSFECDNCHHGKNNRVYIRKGVRIEDIGPVTCANCGCECKL